MSISKLRALLYLVISSYTLLAHYVRTTPVRAREASLKKNSRKDFKPRLENGAAWNSERIPKASRRKRVAKNFFSRLASWCLFPHGKTLLLGMPFLRGLPFGDCRGFSRWKKLHDDEGEEWPLMEWCMCRPVCLGLSRGGLFCVSRNSSALLSLYCRGVQAQDDARLCSWFDGIKLIVNHRLGSFGGWNGSGNGKKATKWRKI